MPLVWRASLRHLLRHPWQTGLCVVGIALGVAVVLAIDLAIASSERAFQLSARAVTGDATDKIVGGPEGVPETLYRKIRIGLDQRRSAPVIELDVALMEPAAGGFHLLGIDPYAEAPFRPVIGSGTTGGLPVAELLTRPGALLLESEMAAELGLEEGDPLTLRVGGARREASVAGLFTHADPARRPALKRILIADIATAQELGARHGFLTRIDLLLDSGPGGAEQRRRIEAVLPAGAALLPADSRTRALGRMMEAFSLNLRFLSLLALVVGAFLIFNTMTFSVVQRRPLLGRLRALGVTRREILLLVFTEGLVLGIAGTAVGVLVGVGLARGLLGVIATTISDLYFAVAVQEVHLAGLPLLKAVLLGCTASALVTLIPAREATRASPRIALSRSGLEGRAAHRAPRLAMIGVALVAAGIGIIAIPSASLAPCYLGLFLIVVGFAAGTALATVLLMRLLRPILGRLFGPFGRMAASGVVASLSRTGVAVGALGIALAMSFGVGTMVRSFRETVATWLDGALRADIYVSLPSTVARQGSDDVLDPTVMERIIATPGIENVITNRAISVESEEGLTRVIALGFSDAEALGYRFKAGDPAAARRALSTGSGVIVSEPFAWRRGLSVGDLLTLRSDSGPASLPVAGVFFDYASDQGYVVIAREAYDLLWKDRGTSALALFLAADQDPAMMVARLQERCEGLQDLLIRSQGAIREVSLEIFDRTFRITDVLRLLASVVAFVGVLSALLALQLERARELGALRAQGMTVRELWCLVTAQTGLMGLAAGLLALPLGALFASILTGEINRRSFGWSLPLDLSTAPILETLALAVVAALLAGLLPARRMSRTSPAEALRTE